MEKLSFKIDQYKFLYQEGRVVNNLETWTDSKLSQDSSKKLKIYTVRYESVYCRENL